jgi:hypothetical protein
MNTITSAFAYLTSTPLALFQNATQAFTSRFTYVQVPHIKLKAEHQALVLFHIVKIALAYWEGWRDGRKNEASHKEEEEDAREESGKEKRRKRKARKVKQRKVVGRGKYTVVFQ